MSVMEGSRGLKWARRAARLAGALVAVGVAAHLAGAVPPLNDLASAYAGRPVTVVRGANGLNGYASGSEVHLAPHLFDALQDPAAFRPGRTRFVQAGYTTDAQWWDTIALYVLLHETAHTRFGPSEGKADCAAVMLMPTALERYGIPFASPVMWRLWNVAIGYARQIDCGQFG